MTDLPRFEARIDARPGDAAWPEAIWPVPADTELRGRFITLRPTTLADAPGLFTALDDAAVWEHVRGRPTGVDGMRALLQRGLDDANWCRFTLRAAQPMSTFESGDIIGSSSLLDTSAGDARTEIGFTVYSPLVWGTAVNPEAKLLLLQYAFESLQFGRVQLKTDIRNVRSQQAIARLGARYEGVLRRYQRRTDNSVRDTVMFSITAEDWPNVKERLTNRLATFSDAV